jgi:hypothetical protein
VQSPEVTTSSNKWAQWAVQRSFFGGMVAG